MIERTISVSTVAFDGYPIDVAFEELARMGIRVVEPAYIRGYMVFGEQDFEDQATAAMNARFKRFGLSCVAISAHMDNGEPDAPNMLARRIRFAAGIGARYVITNSTSVQRRDSLSRALEANLPLAEQLGVIIALENPGNGPDNLMVDGRRGAAVVQSFKSPHVSMNYDTSNALTCTEGETRPEQDIDHALAVSCHMHLKDVVRKEGGWRYVAIGSGEIDYPALLAKLKNRPDIPLSLELPLRLRRLFHHDPERQAELPQLPDIRNAIRSSWNCCAAAFGELKPM